MLPKFPLLFLALYSFCDTSSFSVNFSEVLSIVNLGIYGVQNEEKIIV